MSKNVIVITVDGNKYIVEKNGISDFALVGVLECILSDLKTVKRRDEGSSSFTQSSEAVAKEDTSNLDSPKPEITEVNEPDESIKAEEPVAVTPDLKSRIIKARDAIRGLRGEVDDTDLTIMSEGELQEEFDALTTQYKRLKNTSQQRKR